MIIADSFTVDAPIERVWTLLQDIPKVATCIPNAEITEVVDPATYRAKVAVKVGPVSVSYKATIRVERMDDAEHVAAFGVQGDETRGRGGVRAKVTSQAFAEGDCTRVDLNADAQISGIIASVGGRLIESVAKKTIAEFAANLTKLLT
ncbi:SRPBCC family protein [Vulcanimicrobium alpinum]|uniref:CoxG family protein n=1 Tax=Vulcanimicrobium alpinum TaxID=3016050 RepID=UPI00295E2DE1|nr:SRPBCC family protein [Vulcanimicrobium alpinum]